MSERTYTISPQIHALLLPQICSLHSMRIRKQQEQRDLMPGAAFTSGLHLLAAAMTGAVAEEDVDLLQQLDQTTSSSAGGGGGGGEEEEEEEEEEPQLVEEDEKFGYCGFEEEEEVQVKVAEGEASSCVSDHDLGCKRRRFRLRQARRSQQSSIIAAVQGSDSNIKQLWFSPRKQASDSSDLDTRSCSLQQQTLHSCSGSFSHKTPQRQQQLINGSTTSINSSSAAEKDDETMAGGTSTGTPKHCNKGSSSGTTDQCSKRQRSGAKVQMYDDTVHIRVRHNTFSCSPDSDPFHVDHAEQQPASKKLKAALQLERLGNFFPQITQRRSRRKQRQANLKTEGDESSGVGAEQSSVLSSQLQAQVKPPTPLPPDHPSNHSKESLLHSVYQVFLQAGKAGLTAREAASRVVEQSFPGLHQGGVTGRVQVGKLLRSSPFFMELEEGRFALFSAVIHSNEENLAKSEAEQPPPKKIRKKGTWGAGGGMSPLHKVEVDDGMPAAIKMDVDKSCVEKKTLVQQKKSKRKLIQLTQEGVVGLGEQCKRSDGKSWHCPLRARLGYQLCDYHLDKLRTKLPTNPPKKPNPTIVNKQQKSIRPTPDDSWLVPKKSVWQGHDRRLLEALG